MKKKKTKKQERRKVFVPLSLLVDRGDYMNDFMFSSCVGSLVIA